MPCLPMASLWHLLSPLLVKLGLSDFGMWQRRGSPSKVQIETSILGGVSGSGLGVRAWF